MHSCKNKPGLLKFSNFTNCFVVPVSASSSYSPSYSLSCRVLIKLFDKAPAPQNATVIYSHKILKKYTHYNIKNKFYAQILKVKSDAFSLNQVTYVANSSSQISSIKQLTDRAAWFLSTGVSSTDIARNGVCNFNEKPGSGRMIRSSVHEAYRLRVLSSTPLTLTTQPSP